MTSLGLDNLQLADLTPAVQHRSSNLGVLLRSWGSVMNASMGTGREHLAEYPHKFAELTEYILFGDIWKRTQLTFRERSRATMSVYRLEQLPFHFKRALDNGLSDDELTEVIDHLAFYSG
jgi:4-carboxymuconolactone decarboxylase